MDFSLNTNLQIGFLVEENDDEQESQRIIKKLEQVLLKEKQKTDKISTISTKTEYDKNFETIEEVFKSFIEYSRKVKRIKEDTFKQYETSFRWLLLDYKKTLKIYELEDINKWIEYRDLLTTLPNNFLRRYKDGLDIDDIVYNIIEENDENDKETVLLNSKTINKHFISYNQFLNYLVLFKKIKTNPLDKLLSLNTIENPHNSFSEDEINKLLKDTKDNEIKDFFNVLLHTGMRLSSVLNIRKENINLELKTLNIIDDKTLSGVRKITIHNKIFNILNDYVKSDREHIFFDTRGKDLVQKRINRHIKKTLNINKTIHSFRKNFTQKLFNVCDDINLRKYIIGHSQLRDITFTTYNQEKINIKKMRDIINQISYINIISIENIKDEDIEFC
ncbi:tyrosine-type recombinase/integrase [Sulfurimonas sp.]|uniref:tyrosine-type recombinase/integrase n=1 Tax=Sulfurimonas sp. TaxID=2022749 RepID=UPI0019F6A037|nr:tyrosine-type recombinase/integrase [Sulfurimonas sp.]MBE0514120.1 tyrosine-type recombinase/integrase [Sulfurimonas sp.]